MNLNVMLGAFAAAVASGFVPLINGELIVVGAAGLLAPSHRFTVALICACGQMLAKLLLFSAARWSPRHLPARARAGLLRARSVRRFRGGNITLVAVAATVGVPPFYLVTVAAGLLRMPVLLFAFVGFAGVLLRYSLLVWGVGALAAVSSLP